MMLVSVCRLYMRFSFCVHSSGNKIFSYGTVAGPFELVRVSSAIMALQIVSVLPVLIVLRAI
jgi:hypothetical protein